MNGKTLYNTADRPYSLPEQPRELLRQSSESSTPELSFNPRKRKRFDSLDEDLTRQGPFDRFVTSASPNATSELRSAFRYTPKDTPYRGSVSALPTPSTSSHSPYAEALGIGGGGRLLHHGPPISIGLPQSEEELTLQRLNTTPTRQSAAAFPHTLRSISRNERTISRVPERVLDAPGLKNDYYIDVLDWSANNVLAVGLDNRVYLWDEKTAEIHELWAVDRPDYITACHFSPDGSKIAVGSDLGRCEIITVPKNSFQTGKCKVRITHHNGLSALTWCKEDGNLYLTTGDKHGVIRVYNTTARRMNSVSRSRCELVREWADVHDDRVVGLKWSPDARTLASGGNDNLVCLWQMEREAPKVIIRHHTSAVRALAWCPWNPELLATGGGLEDRKIRIYNNRGEKKIEINTGSQVCTINWSKAYKELISSHHTVGDQLIIWSWPSMTEITRLPGHHQRPLFLAMNPTGETVVTGSGDENLKFWRCFQMQHGQRLLRPSESEIEEQRRIASDMR